MIHNQRRAQIVKVARTQIRDADTAREVKHFSSVFELYMTAFAACDDSVGHSVHAARDVTLSKLNE